MIPSALCRCSRYRWSGGGSLCCEASEPTIDSRGYSQSAAARLGGSCRKRAGSMLPGAVIGCPNQTTRKCSGRISRWLLYIGMQRPSPCRTYITLLETTPTSPGSPSTGYSSCYSAARIPASNVGLDHMCQARLGSQTFACPGRTDHQCQGDQRIENPFCLGQEVCTD